MKKILLSGLLLVLLVNNNAHSQAIQNFSSDPQKFLAELTLFFDNVSKEEKKEAKEFIDAFTLTWNSNKISESRKSWVPKTCNLMVKKRLKALPHFKYYLTTLTNFSNSNQTDDSYIAWHKALENLLSKPSPNQFVKFLESTDDLLINYTLFKNNNVTWTVSNNNYSFIFDTVPKVVFIGCNLICTAAGGKHTILDTKGTFAPLSNQFFGKEGKVLWTNAGFDESMVRAELKTYTLNLRFGEFSADSAKFYHTAYFNFPLIGKVTNRPNPEEQKDNATFPKFESYEKRYKINNIFQNIDFEGGLTMNGSRMIGSGDEMQDASMSFKWKGKTFVIIKSKLINIQKEAFSSDNVAATILLESDSIYHPAVQLRYSDKDRTLTLMRDEQALSRTPFFDSYHKVLMYFEELNWNLNRSEMDFKMSLSFGSKGKALFESSNYFSMQRYKEIQGIDVTNPLEIIFNIVNRKKSRIVNAEDIAAAMRTSVDQINPMLINLSWMGFLSYNPYKGTANVNDLLMNYVNSRYGRIDYDVIQFRSETETGKNHATLDLKNFDLKIRGVDMVKISDSQKVAIIPYEKLITLKKNRDFAFNGTIHSGMFTFYGNDFFFEYDKFKIYLNNTDSMSMVVLDKTKQPDAYGRYPLKRVRTVLERINGELLVDDPNNKSGLKKKSQYPIFNSNNESYVYYDREFIHRGVYKKDNFYFKIQPFSIDSLDEASTDNIAFNGVFHSGGIFPDFKEDLKVQPDLSLGFVRKTPDAGMALYNGKGKYFNTINLSYKGLRGDGIVTYLTSTSKSKDFYFFPDSMNAEVQAYDIKEQIAQVEYPNVKSTDIYVHWRPYKDVMLAQKKKNAFDCYDGKSYFSGKLFLTPKLLSGNGYIEFFDAELSSNNIKFKQHEFDADTADFKLKALNATELAFTTDNYKSHIDFNKMKGEFKANAGVSQIDFPLNQYIAYMDEFDWFIDKKEIELANTKSQDIAKLDKYNLKQLADHDFTGSEFISTRQGQDSLRFFCAKAKYSLNDNIIHAMNVKIIKVGDAAIYPDKGDVTIYKRAEMESFENAQILANTTTKYHTFYNATVNIAGRKQYEARGKYDYVDEKGQKQLIYFDKISLDPSLQTVATGKISAITEFTLSPAYDYFGDVRLEAAKEFITFDGNFRIKHNCEALPKTWIKFTTAIDPKNIYLPIPHQPLDSAGKPVFAAIMLSNDSTQIYSAFLNPKNHRNDFELVSSNGFLYFDNVSKEYRISNREKLKQFSLPGNYLSMNINSCMVYGEGKLNFGTKLGQIKTYTFGNIRNYSNDKRSEFDIVMTLDFFFADDALKIMSESLFKNYKLEAVNFNREVYTKTLFDLLGTDAADKLISDLNLYGEMKKVPQELIHTITFTDLKMNWNMETRSYVSYGKIGIGGIGKTQINKYVNGYVELVRKRNGDIINIYLEPEKDEWYFFNYQNEVLQAISSNQEFNNIISNMKAENRVQKTPKDEPAFSFTLSSERKKKDFVKKFITE